MAPNRIDVHVWRMVVRRWDRFNAQTGFERYPRSSAVQFLFVVDVPSQSLQALTACNSTLKMPKARTTRMMNLAPLNV
jgi:hypothetical protein